MTRRTPCGVAASRGFTLIELLLALGVIAILLAAILPAAGGWLITGKLRATMTTAQSLAEAVRQYRVLNGTWPVRWTDLGTTSLANTAPTTPWGDAFTLSSTANLASITATVPLASVPAGLSSPMTEVSVVGGSTQLTVRVLIPEETATLAFERNRVSGSTGF